MNSKHLGMGILIAALFLTGCGRQKSTSYEPDTTHASLPETKLTFFGYKYEAIDCLITNFHLPKSTLLMLISAFASKEFIFKAYQEAIDEKYRFFSFGDSMFIM